MSDKPTALIVCPTEYGGQLEHATDLAAAISDIRATRATVVTRPGARAYFGVPIPNVEFVESLPPRRVGNGRLNRIKKALLQFGDLVREQLLLSREIRRMAPAVVILDASRYPAPRALIPRARRSATRVVLYLHNVHPHDRGSRKSMRSLVLGCVERLSIRNSDDVIIHGEAQYAAFVEQFGRDPIVTQLPDTTYLPVRPFAIPELASVGHFHLCLGEVRRNKGVEIAIQAAASAGVRLVVAGAPESVEYEKELATISGGVSNVMFVPRFLSREEFDWALRNASSVILPYTHFSAQSGVATRAAAVGAFILASDLPALKEQLREYSRVEYFSSGSPSSLAALLKRHRSRESNDERVDVALAKRREQWRSVVSASWCGDAGV